MSNINITSNGNENICDSYANLKFLYGQQASTLPSTKVIKTNGDKKFASTMELFELGARLSDANNEIDNCVGSLLDNPNKRKLEQVVGNIKNSIIPFISCAAKSVTCAVQKLAPVASLKDLHCWNEVKQKREDAKNKNNSKKRKPLQNIDNYVTKTKIQNPEIPRVLPPPPPPHFHMNLRKGLPLSLLVPPPPMFGDTYRKTEFIDSITKQKPHACSSSIINAMVQKWYVPVKCNALYTLICKAQIGLPIIDDAWARQGRPPLMEDEQCNKIANELATHVGMSLGKDDINSLLVNHQKEKFHEQGFVPTTVHKKKDRTTINRCNYCKQL